MEYELLTVGTELLLGFTVDTNAAVMGRLLAEAGLPVRRHVSVRDEAGAIRDALRAALEHTGTVIVSGGLGPTEDDLTAACAAEVFGRRLVRSADHVAKLEAWYRRRGMPMPAANLKQADAPEGATLLDNPLGTAPGLWIEDGPRLAVLLPGVPKELRGLMEQQVVPRLMQRRGTGAQGHGGTVVRSRTLRTTGIGESALADLLGDARQLLGERVTLAYLPTLAGTDLRCTTWDLPEGETDAALGKAVETLRARAGAHVYGEGDEDLAAVLLRRLEAEGAKLALAESCTGGLLGARVTAVPGSSRVFAGGVVAYDDDVKLGQLGVSADALAQHGAVSEVVARQMAEGAARGFGTEAAIGVTGIAGPDGGTAEKPVGTVWIAIRWRDLTRAFTFVFPGDRDDVRQRAAQWALDRLRRIVSGLT